MKVSNQWYPLQPEQSQNLQCCESGSGIRDQGSGAFLTPGFGSGIQDQDPGWVKSQDPDPGSGSGMETRNKFLRAEKPFFLVKILKFFDADLGSRIRDEKYLDLGSGIRD